MSDKRKILIVGGAGAGTTNAIHKAIRENPNLPIIISAEHEKMILGSLPHSEPTMILKARELMPEPFINMDDVESIGIRGITNNRKLKKKRKKKNKKTHRKK